MAQAEAAKALAGLLSKVARYSVILGIGGSALQSSLYTGAACGEAPPQASPLRPRPAAPAADPSQGGTWAPGLPAGRAMRGAAAAAAAACRRHGGGLGSGPTARAAPSHALQSMAASGR